MTDIINLLPDSVANQIAAGEVIQRPAAAVKELLENALDSGASEIKLVVKDSGKSLIQVIDNGCGMSPTDARMSFERHATSKIKNADDLFDIRTMGFRGEALASVAAIAHVELRTKRVEDELGSQIIIEGTKVNSQTEMVCNNGSIFSIKNLFFNTPARRNFLKSDTVEFRHIQEVFTTFSQIIGQRSVYKTGKLTVGLNFYYQMGNDKSVYFDNADNLNYHKKMSAYNVRLDLGYKINENLKAGVGFEMLSGQSQTDTTADYGQGNHAFTPLYGTNHKFNGWMDYFYVGNHINSVGLNDIFLTLDYSKNKLIAGAQFHYFMAAADVRDMKEFNATGDIKAMSANLGMELDTYVGYKFDKKVLFKAGVSGMFDSETMRALKGGDGGASNYWGWMMVVIKPDFLNM